MWRKLFLAQRFMGFVDDHKWVDHMQSFSISKIGDMLMPFDKLIHRYAADRDEPRIDILKNLYGNAIILTPNGLNILHFDCAPDLIGYCNTDLWTPELGWMSQWPIRTLRLSSATLSTDPDRTQLTSIESTCVRCISFKQAKGRGGFCFQNGQGVLPQRVKRTEA